MNKQIKNLTTRDEEMEGARRATGISSDAAPNPEVSEKAIRRSYNAEYKRRILKEAEGCKEKAKLELFCEEKACILQI